ncbi:hypothetical protein INR49_003964 [Caranx melampygus]|nr:hypothetical protein INR49_003964 [Caranx melampygus]
MYGYVVTPGSLRTDYAGESSLLLDCWFESVRRPLFFVLRSISGLVPAVQGAAESGVFANGDGVGEQLSWRALTVSIQLLNPSSCRILTQYQLTAEIGPVPTWQTSSEDEAYIYRTGCISGCEFLSCILLAPLPFLMTCVWVFVVELDKGPYGLGMGLIDGLTENRRPDLAVNGTSLIGADYQSAVDLIRLGGGRLRFLVAKSDPRSQRRSVPPPVDHLHCPTKTSTHTRWEGEGCRCVLLLPPNRAHKHKNTHPMRTYAA